MAATILTFALSSATTAQTYEADRAAAQMFDSLFEPEAPAEKPQETQRARRGRGSGLVGTLAHNGDTSDGTPPFVLVDRYGGVLRYIEPVEGIDLDSRIGSEVSVRHDTGDILLASQLALPRTSRGASGVQLAQYSEPMIVGEGVVVPEGSEPVMIDEGIDFGLPSRPRAGAGYAPVDLRTRPPFYARGEYVLWWFNGFYAPPLVTTADTEEDAGILEMPGATDDPLDFNLPRPTTQILSGGGDMLDNLARNGARVTLGTWLGDWAIEGDYTVFGEERESTAFTSADASNPDTPIISRPFFNLWPLAIDAGDADGDGDITEVIPPSEAIEMVVYPDVVDGSVTVTATSDFATAGVHVRLPVCCEDPCQLGCGDSIGCGGSVGCGTLIGGGRPARQTDFILGYRYAKLNEMLQIYEDLYLDPEFSTEPDHVTVLDRFTTENVFNGAEIGFISEWLWRRWSFELLSKLAIGNNRQTVTVFGTTSAWTDGVPEVGSPSDEGIYAVETNIGTQRRDEFAIMPELGATLGFSLTQRVRLTAGYSLIYLTPVVRPGDQIDRELNRDYWSSYTGGGLDPTPSTSPPRPEPRFVTSDLFAHGLRLGLHVDW